MKYSSLFLRIVIIAVCIALQSSIVKAQYSVPVQDPIGQEAIAEPLDGSVVATDGFFASQMPSYLVRDRADGWYKTICPMSCDQFWGPGEWRFNSWVDQGITYGSSRIDDTFAPQAYNDMYNTYQMNQVYMALERKVAEDGMSFSWGGRVDVLFGTDYYYTQAYGLEASNVGYLTTINGPEGRVNHWNGDGNRHLAQNVSDYGVSLPQAYVEMYMPILTGVKVKAGHYYSGMSMETPMAVENFFYSHNYASYYGMPTTLTGIEATFGGSVGLSVFGGVDLGWNRMSTKSGVASGYGGVRWMDPCRTLATQFMVHSGNETWTFKPNRYADLVNAEFNVTVLSWLTEWRLNSWLATSLEFVYGWDDKGDFPRSNVDSSTWVGITNSWYVRCTDTITTGLRFEWFQDNPQCGRIVYSQMFDDTCYNVFDITLGVNWKPTYWCTVRPEVRWDWSDLNGELKFFGDKNSQFTFGMDILLNF
ncbi:MAG: outer membrane beta-barrel protein [Thermoguttaceae bacterium]|nr:outer membrane beta-barrel protein [Thermoguttaceae bacterium]